MSVHKKIVEVMRSVEYLKKDDSVGEGRFSYKAISEEKVTKAIRDQLIHQGLTIYPIKQEHKMMDYDGGVNTKGNPVINHMAIVDVTYRITDIDDDTFIDVCSSGTGVDTQDKAVGKAMTYCYKYMLLRTFAIPTGEDPDKVASVDIDNGFEAEVIIDEKSRQALYVVGGYKGYSKDQINKQTKKKYGKNLPNIEIEQYNELLANLKKLPDKAAK